jgi:hypothetical protein
MSGMSRYARNARITGIVRLWSDQVVIALASNSFDTLFADWYSYRSLASGGRDIFI